MSIWTLEEQKAHRKLWVEALRSGKYKQGTDFLNAGGKMCCLGVLCDIAGLEWEEDTEGVYAVGGEKRSAPDEAKRFVGLRDNCGGFNHDGDEDYPREELTNLNDSGASFAEIADIIESEPPGLFIEAAP